MSRSKVAAYRRRSIWRFMCEYQAARGFPPSIREICDATGITSTSVVNFYLAQLEAAGKVERRGTKGQARAVVALEAKKPAKAQASQG